MYLDNINNFPTARFYTNIQDGKRKKDNPKNVWVAKPPKQDSRQLWDVGGCFSTAYITQNAKRAHRVKPLSYCALSGL